MAYYYMLDITSTLTNILLFSLLLQENINILLQYNSKLGNQRDLIWPSYKIDNTTGFVTFKRFRQYEVACRHPQLNNLKKFQIIEYCAQFTHSYLRQFFFFLSHIHTHIHVYIFKKGFKSGNMTAFKWY